MTLRKDGLNPPDELNAVHTRGVRRVDFDQRFAGPEAGVTSRFDVLQKLRLALARGVFPNRALRFRIAVVDHMPPMAVPGEIPRGEAPVDDRRIPRQPQRDAEAVVFLQQGFDALDGCPQSCFPE